MKGSIHKAYLFTALLLVSHDLKAQVSDDFTDGDFTNNPTWIGDETDFIVKNQMLQLNNTVSAKSYISTKAEWRDTASWNFWIKLDFAPSTSNRLRIYLSFDKADFSGSGNGYFLEIGESGSEDNLELYKQSGNDVSLLAQGTESTMGGSSNECRLRVTRSQKGEFAISADFNGGNNLSVDFDAVDNTYAQGEYFGFWCDYTSTRADKFFFDDVVIDPIFKDTKAPELLSVNVANSSSLYLEFNEPVDSQTAVLLNNYDLNGVSPIAANWASISSDRIQLDFGANFISGTNYTLTAAGIEDEVGNELVSTQKSFRYYLPSFGDLIINEVFPDPTPSQGLPDYEFVEIYNPSDFNIDLSNWRIEDAASGAVIDSAIIEAGAYLIICPHEAVSNFETYGFAVGVSLPALNNGGDHVKLIAPNGLVVDEIMYTPSWYNDQTRSNGGFSIERINQITQCSSANNWMASQNNSGGTPGVANSVLDNSPDVTPPQLVASSSIDGKSFALLFNEPVDSTAAVNANYIVAGVGVAVSASFNAKSPFEVEIDLPNVITENTAYNIEINGIEDCEGNALNQTYTNAIIYIVAVKAQLYDVVISEIMADPEPTYDLPSAEYLELSNASDKVINIGDLHIKAGKDKAELDSFVLFPGEVLTICKSSEAYLFEPFGNVMGVSGFPGLSNSGELLELRNTAGNLIHFVDYNDVWYKNDIKEDGGFSLEMIDLKNPCGEADNWNGARGNAYGTPGNSNSVLDDNNDNEAPFVTRAVAIDSNLIELHFNEICDSTLLAQSTSYKSLQNIFGIEKVQPVQIPFKSVQLKLSSQVPANTYYKLQISGIGDCMQNMLNAQIEFVRPGKLDSFDFVINEVLFNPASGGFDFVELYNRSQKQLNLKGLLIANRNDNSELTSVSTLSEGDLVLPPNGYVVFTENKEDVLKRYEVWEPDFLIETNLPSMPDNNGEVVLLATDSMVIDELSYSSDWHYALLEDDDGVSIERIDPDKETQNEANWASASGLAGGATPVRKNSQYKTTEHQGTTIDLSGKSFSPDNDGFEDKLQITINTEGGDQSVTIKVFDLGGRMIHNLVGHEVLGTQSLFAWDGFDDKGVKAPVGVYIILIEIINLETGKAERFKESVVLKGRL